jgi:hypothetical protein
MQMYESACLFTECPRRVLLGNSVSGIGGVGGWEGEAMCSTGLSGADSIIL